MDPPLSRPRWGVHITARAQERILTMAVAVDARVSGWKQSTQVRSHASAVGRQRTACPWMFPEECWAVVDDVNLRDLFELRFPVLQSCPHHVRGQCRQANRQVLEARNELARSHDTVLVERKCFPLHVVSSSPSRRRQGEQGRIVQEGSWETLVDEAAACVSLPTPQREAPN